MFYHLTRQPLEQVLPTLLHKTLERGWRALVLCGNPLRLRPLSDAIWSWREDSFIAHGTPEDGDPTRQPVLLLPEERPAAEAAANGADVLFCVEGARPTQADLAHFRRVCVLFADADAAGKERMRALWRELKEADGLALTYWQQDMRGGWERKA